MFLMSPYVLTQRSLQVRSQNTGYKAKTVQDHLDEKGSNLGMSHGIWVYHFLQKQKEEENRQKEIR